MKVTINGYEIEAPDDCSVTVEGSKIRVERQAAPAPTVVPVYVERERPAPSWPAWPNTTPWSPIGPTTCGDTVQWSWNVARIDSAGTLLGD